jgi:cytochrome c biogenesis protein
VLEVFLSETEKKKTDIFESLWKFFASVKLAIFIFIILAVSSIIGTIVEQQAEPAKNIALLAKFFGDSAAPTVYNIFAKLGFMDMYRSWWFVSFLILFCLNLIVCSLERLPKTWKFIQRPLKPLTESGLKAMPIKREQSLKTSVKVAKDEFVNALTSAGYKILEATGDDSVQIYTQKGKFGRLGAYVVHISIILIFIGAIIGARFGFNAYLNLPEGATSDVAYSSPTDVIPLGFSIKCNWYNTEYYNESMAPREFQSELVVIEDGREVLRKVIEVNDPLVYKGITFFQSSYGVLRGTLDEFFVSKDPTDGRMSTLQPSFSRFPNRFGYFILTVASANGQTETLRLRRGDTFSIPGTDIRGTVVGFSPTLDRDRATGALGTNIAFKDQLVMPAVAVEIDAPGRNKFVGWFLKNERITVLPDADHTIEFKDFRGIEYTGLQVSRDPGVWLIYIACIVMAIGLYVSFFIPHKKIWVNIAGAKNSVRVSVGATANRNKLNLENEIDKLVSAAKEAIEGRSKK